MRFALTEMRRRPGRFVTAAVTLTLIAVLLTFLGGLLDGLIAGSTNALAAQPGELIVFSPTAQDTLVASRISAAQREQVARTPGVAEVGGLSVLQLGARLPHRQARDLVDVAVFGYDLAPRGVPPPPAPGEAWADELLRARGVDTGTKLHVGPARTPLTVAGFVSDTSYAGQASLWASEETWRAVASANRPDVRTTPDVTQALVVHAADTTPTAVAALGDAIDRAAGTRTLTTDEAVEAVPGVSQQRSTFTQIIGITVVVAAVVVALFFALIVVERTALYGVLKAMGARPGALVGGVVAQAVMVSATAAAVGVALAVGLGAALPTGSVPFELRAGRVGASAALVLAAAVGGSLTTMRRVLRIDPASAIGRAA